MALTDAQKALCREYLGWSFGFFDRDSLLEQAFSGIATKPEEELRITDTLENGGYLANLQDIETKLRAAHRRLKADKVATIVLNRRELKDLRSEGDRFIGKLSRCLGVPVRNGGGFASFNHGIDSDLPDNYIGK